MFMGDNIPFFLLLFYHSTLFSKTHPDTLLNCLYIYKWILSKKGLKSICDDDIITTTVVTNERRFRILKRKGKLECI